MNVRIHVPLIIVLLLTLPVCQVCAAEIWESDEKFSTWEESLSRDTLLRLQTEFADDIELNGPRNALSSLILPVKNAQGSLPDSVEYVWIESFLDMLDSSGVNQTYVNLSLSEDADIDTVFPKSARKQVLTNIFSTEDALNYPYYAIFPGHGDKEIRIDPDATGRIAKLLWIKTKVLHGTLTDLDKLPRENTVAVIKASLERWNAYVEHSVSGQLPWETFLTEKIFPPSLSGPQRVQIRFLHLLPMVEMSRLKNSEAGAVVDATLGAEIAGLILLDDEEFRRNIGLSFLTVPPLETDEGFGFGGLLHLRDWSIGAVIQNQKEEEEVLSIVVGVDFVSLIMAGGGGKSSSAANTLSRILEQISD